MENPNLMDADPKPAETLTPAMTLLLKDLLAIRTTENWGNVDWLIVRAKANYYDDIKGVVVFGAPQIELMTECKTRNLPTILNNIRAGKYDSVHN